MNEARRPAQPVRFGAFEVDFQARELRKSGLRLKLHEKPFQILELLLERAGEVVTRKDLREKLWPDTFVGFDRSLNTALNTLRRALGDSARNPRFVETRAGRGYRFIGPVARAGRAAFPPTRKIMLAVLPFENSRGDPEQEYFSDGLTEEMITQLGRLHPKLLGVIASTSAMRYKGTDKGLDEIAEELGVDYILEGNVRRAADRVRITAQLIDVTDQTHLWANSYEQQLEDIFALQRDVATSIARSLELELLPAPQATLVRPAIVSLAAYEAYLKGRYYWNKFTEEGAWKGILQFEQAIKEDPRYAPAYVGLALCYAQLAGFFGAVPAIEAFPKAKAAALKALEIEDTLAEAHGSLGICSLFYDWDWTSAERQFLRALELNPGYALSHHQYALYLMAMGRLEEALREEKQALELDPLSLLFSTVLGWVFLFARQYDRAIKQCRRTLELDPNFSMAHWQLGRAWEQKGMLKEAITAFRKAVNLSGASPACVAGLGHAYGLADKRAEAAKILDELLDLSKRRYVSSYFIASIYASLGEIEQVFQWLEKAYEERPFWFIFLNIEPTFDNLRLDPRFQDLLRRVALPAQDREEQVALGLVACSTKRYSR